MSMHPKRNYKQEKKKVKKIHYSQNLNTIPSATWRTTIANPKATELTTTH